MKRRTPSILLAAALTLGALLPQACHPTEESYRNAYLTAKNGGDGVDATPFDSTIYSAQRRQADTRTVATPYGSVDVRTQHVRITDGGGGIPQSLRRYNVVAAQFKQRFNAISMRERLVDDENIAAAIVVETAEPYYYVIAGSYANADSAYAALDRLRRRNIAAVRPPCPFILDATARRAPAAAKK